MEVFGIIIIAVILFIILKPLRNELADIIHRILFGNKK
jgi:hypothetical protein